MSFVEYLKENEYPNFASYIVINSNAEIIFADDDEESALDEKTANPGSAVYKLLEDRARGLDQEEIAKRDAYNAQ